MARKQELDIVIKATNEASAEFKKVNDDLKKTKSGAEDAQKGFKGLNSGLEGLQKGLAGAAGAFAVLKTTFDFAKEGIAISKVATTFENLSESVGATAGFMERLTEATGGAVTNLELMQGANKILGLGLAGTEDEAVNLIEIAVKLGSAFGEDAATSIDNFGLLLANQSVARLDSFGIASSDVRAKMDLLTTGTDALTTEQAFLQATLEGADEAMERLGVSGATATDSITRLETKFANLFNTIKVGIADGVTPYADGITSIAAAHGRLRDEIEQNTTDVINQSDTYEDYIDVLRTSEVTIDGLTRAQFAAEKARLAQIKAQELEIRVLGELEDARQAELDDLERIATATTRRQIEASEAADKIELAELGVSEAIERSTQLREEQAERNTAAAASNIAARQAEAAEGRRLFEQEIEQINTLIQARQVQLGTAAARQLELSQTAEQAAAAEGTFADELLNQAAALGISATQLALGAQATGLYTDEQITAALKTALMQEEVARLAQAVANEDISIQQAISSLNDFQAELDETSASLLQVAADADAIPNNIPITVTVTQEGTISVPTASGRQDIVSNARGGPLAANQVSLVGEEGPELFVSNSAGQIINNTDTQQMLGGTTNITINVNSPMMATPEAIANSVSNELGRRMRG